MFACLGNDNRSIVLGGPEALDLWMRERASVRHPTAPGCRCSRRSAILATNRGVAPSPEHPCPLRHSQAGAAGVVAPGRHTRAEVYPHPGMGPSPVPCDAAGHWPWTYADIQVLDSDTRSPRLGLGNQTVRHCAGLVMLTSQERLRIVDVNRSQPRRWMVDRYEAVPRKRRACDVREHHVARSAARVWCGDGARAAIWPWAGASSVTGLARLRQETVAAEW